MHCAYDRIKDDKPLNTVNRARNILHRLDIMVSEEWFGNNIIESLPCYSVRLFTDFFDFGVNGKGVTREYALASAYGELMERLQSGMFFERVFNFLQIPDLVKASLTAGKKNILYWQIINSNPYFNIQDKNDCVNKFWNCFLENQDNYSKNVPFYDVNNKDVVLIPYDLLTFKFGTTGLCAGNSKFEAIVHGLCEVMEIYAANSVLMKDIVMPVIPLFEYQGYGAVADILAMCQSLGLEVQVRDASLGQRIPVVCVILINKQNGTYLIKYGAFPVFSIALERCLTELFQGVDFNNINEFYNIFSPLEPLTNITDYSLAEISAISIKKRLYPAGKNFFNEGALYSYDAKVWVDTDSHGSNEVLVKLLMQRISNLSFNVYIRDIDFLGFPAYWILVPEMSVSANNEESRVSGLIDCLFANGYGCAEIKEVMTCGFVTHLQLASALKNQDFSGALTCVNKIMSTLKNQDENIKYEYMILKSFIEIRLAGISLKKAEKQLLYLFNNNEVFNVLKAWIYDNSVSGIINLIMRIKTDNEQQLSHIKRRDFAYRVCRALSLEYKKHTPEQKSLKKLF